MRIAIVVTQSEQGGVQVFLSQFIRWLKAQNHEIRLYAGHDGWLMNECKKQEIPCKKLRFLKREIHPLFDVLAIAEIYYELRNFKPNAVHLNSSKVGIIASIGAKLAGVPNVTYRIGGWVFLEDLPTWKKSVYQFLEKVTARFKDRIICVHPNDKSIAESIGIKPKKEIIIVPNGIDIKDFENELWTAEKARHELGLKEGLVFGTIANFYPAKNLTQYIEACAIVVKAMPEVQCIIIGEGAERKAIEQAIQKLKLEKNVLLSGAKENADVLYKALDIFVLPSTKEGMSWALLRAMAAERPCIATDVGAAKWMLKNDAGIIVPAKEPELLAEAMIKLAQNASQRTKISHHAKEAVKNRFPLAKTLEGNTKALTS